jgi:tRNA-2-methylthio-N6-dimethylallyladenosine synthase
MNEADSEKVNMLLMQSGFVKVGSWQEANLVIFNTCSVRKKGEDRVYSIMNDILKSMKASGKQTVTGITGCMVRKTGMNKKYLAETTQRERVKKIEYIKNSEGIFNYDDKLFPKIEILDFTLRIEEIKYLSHILSHIYEEKIGQEDKFDDYLKARQQRENPYSASIIVQTGCDNYCSFCIVPFTRGKEISRPISEIVAECEDAAKK